LKEGAALKTIREFREQAGITQLQLANELGVTPSTVYNWERGRNEPKASQLKAMATLFGVTMDDIDFEAGEAKAPRDQATRRRNAQSLLEGV